jgi:homeodomain-containing protein
MSRFPPNAKRLLDSLLNLITDLAGDVLLFFRLLFCSRTALSAEILFLRKQLAFYEERQVQPRRLNDSARFSLILWSRLCNWKEALVIVKLETLISWHRKGFKLFWKWKSRAGRPRLPGNIRKLIVQMAQENPTWGQARVAAELSVKLGIYVSPRTVRAYWSPEPERRGSIVSRTIVLMTKRFYCKSAKAQSAFSASIFAGRRTNLQFQTEELAPSRKKSV